MKVKIPSSSSLSGSLRVPTSKSYTHRAYLTALLGEGGTIKYPLTSEDTDATLDALDQFSVDVEVNDSKNTVEINPHSPLRIESDTINVAESGTLLRFLIPICTVLNGPGEVTLIGEESLCNRSNRESINSLKQAGFEGSATGEESTVPVVCYPGQPPTDFPLGVACNSTSQYLSGWLLALVGINGGTLKRTTRLVSAPYVSMTEDVLTEAGVTVDHPEDDSYSVETSSLRPLDYPVPGDFSSAAFFLVGASVLDGEVSLRGLRRDDRQADRRIVEILQELGVAIEWHSVGEADELVVDGPAKITDFSVDASDCPDLVPVLSVLGALADGDATITNVAHLANKESDRINRTAEELRKTGVRVRTDRGSLTISGSPKLSSTVELNAHGDHRLAMAFSILGVKLGKIQVAGVEAVSKSYPGFFDDLKKLGAEIELVQ